MRYVTHQAPPHLSGLLPAGVGVDIALLVGPVGDPAPILRQLIDGALAPHALVRLGGKGDKHEVVLVAAYDCACFGLDIKGGTPVVGINIDGRQSAEQKQAIAQAILAGRCAGSLLPYEKPIPAEPDPRDAELAELRKQLADAEAALAAAREGKPGEESKDPAKSQTPPPKQK